MRRSLVVLLVMACWVFTAFQGKGDESPTPARPKGNRDSVEKGMSPEKVRALLGPPKRIARQILFRRYLEQWTYDAPIAARIEFDSVRGQEAQVVSVHSLRSEKP